MDKSEAIVASKRVAKWPDGDRKWLVTLTPSEREVILVLVAHLDARPSEEGTHD